MNFSGLGKESTQIQVPFCKPSHYFCNVMSLMACTISEDLFPLVLRLVRGTPYPMNTSPELRSASGQAYLSYHEGPAS